MSWTNQHKIFSLETFFATKSYQSVQIQFRKRFHCPNFPSKSTIVSWIKKFREHGTVVDLCSKATGGTFSGRKKSARTEENIAAVRDSVGHSPRKSVRRRSQGLEMTRESLRRVLTSDLHLYPYKIQIKQKLTDADKEKRVTMCEWFCNVLENDENFDVEWAPHSPDLNPPDFYLWGFLKDNVYQGNPQTIEELKTAITAKIRAIPKEECIKVIQNFARRVQVCTFMIHSILNGGHLEHILGKP